MTTRRKFLGLLGTATLLAACPSGPTTTDGGSPSAFVTTAGNILVHLDQVLGGLPATLPDVVGTAVSVARAAIGVALATLHAFEDGGSTCRDIGGVVTSALRATLGVFDALTRAGTAVPSVLSIGAAGAATIVDQAVSFLCGPATDAGATRDVGAVLTTRALQGQFTARGLAYPQVPATLVAAPVAGR